MQDICNPEIDQTSLIMKETCYGITLVSNKYHLCMFLKINDVIEESQYSTKIVYIFFDTLLRRTYFWDTAVPCGSKNSHNVVQLNPDEDKYYLLTPYPTLMQPLKKRFHLKVLELLPATRISIYNRSASTLNQTYNTNFVHNNFRNYLQKCTPYNDNQ